MAESKSRNN